MDAGASALFLTEVKTAKHIRESSVGGLKEKSTALRSIDASQDRTRNSNMISYGFLTSMPLSGFIDIAHKDANR